MYNQDLFSDSDFLICFLAVGQCGILNNLFPKIVVSSVVQEEILRSGTPIEIRCNFNRFMENDSVELKPMVVGSNEHKLYNNLKKKYKFMGDGEAAVMSLACKNEGVIASNNLVHVRGVAQDNDRNIVTTAFVLAKAYESGVKSRKELDELWEGMLKKARKRSLPRNVKSFTEYYEGKYVDDSLYMKLE